MPNSPTTLFIAAAANETDQNFRKELRKHLRIPLLTIKDQDSITAGSAYQQHIADLVQQADIVLLLISIDFLDAAHPYGQALKKAVQQHKAKQKHLIPILLRPCDWEKEFGLGELLPLPAQDTFISSQTKAVQELSWTKVAKEVKRVVEELRKQKSQLPTLDAPKAPQNGLSSLKGMDLADALMPVVKEQLPQLWRNGLKENEQAFELFAKLKNILSGEIEMQLDCATFKKQYPELLFNRVFTNEQLDRATIEEVRDMKDNPKFFWYDRLPIVSALTVTSIGRFDKKRLQLLLDFVFEGEEKVWEMALIGLLFSLLLFDKQLNSHPDLVRKLRRLQNIPEVQSVIRKIFDIIHEDKTFILGSYEHLKDTEIVNKTYYYFLPIYKQNPILQREINALNLNFDKEQFCDLLTRTFSLNSVEQYCVVFALHRLEIEQIKDLIAIFIEEQQKFKERQIEFLVDIKLAEIYHYIKQLFLFYQLTDWSKIKSFVEQKQELYQSSLWDVINKQLEALELRALALEKRKNYQELLEVRKRIAQLNPKNVWNLRQIGVCNQHLKDYSTALDWHLKSHKIEPENAWNLRAIGNCHQELKDYSTALDWHLQSHKIEPDNADNLDHIGFCHQKLKDYSTALDWHLQSHKIEPDNAWNLRAIGNCHQELKDYSTALDWHLQSHKIEPDNAWNLRQIGICHQHLKDYRTALDWHLQSHKIEPDNAWNLRAIGNCHRQLKDYSTALDWYLKSHNIEPENAWNLRQIGAFYQYLNDYSTALDWHLQSHKIEPENAWNLRQIGECHQQLNDYVTALDWHLKSHKIEPKDASNLRLIGHCHWFLNNKKAAQTWFVKAHQINPDAGVMGWNYFILGDLQKSYHYLHPLVQQQKADQHDLMTIGHIELCRGNTQQAYNYYHQSIALFPNFQAFINGFEDDLKYLTQYGITPDFYASIKAELVAYYEK